MGMVIGTNSDIAIHSDKISKSFDMILKRSEEGNSV